MARRSRPTTSTSFTAEHRRTWLGPIDPLCELAEGKGYDDLLAHSVPMITEDERTLQVLDLPTLIELKTKAGRPKDRVVLPILIATLQERDNAKDK
jgi:hypothetical protein